MHVRLKRILALLLVLVLSLGLGPTTLAAAAPLSEPSPADSSSTPPQGEWISDLALTRNEITIGSLMNFFYMEPGEEKYQMFGINPQGAQISVESGDPAVALVELVDTPAHITGNQDLTCTANTPNERDDVRELKVTAVAPGRTTITVTATADGYQTTQATFTVQVLAPTGQNTFRRDVNINAGWSFCLEKDLPDGVGLEQVKDPAYDGGGFTPVDLPHTWNVEDVQNELTRHYGVGYYRKSMTFPSQDYAGRRIYIEIGAANKVSNLYINGTLVGTHSGGYAKFRYDITDYVTLDEANLICVQVDNSIGSTVMPLEGGFAYSGGMYRNNFILSTAQVSFDKLDYGSSGIYLTPTQVSAQSAGLDVRAQLRNAGDTEQQVLVRARLYEQDGSTLVREVSGDVTVPAGGTAAFQQSCTVENPHLWNGVPDPYQYIVEVTLEQDGQVLERERETVGFRFFEITEDDGFYLNGQPYPLHGVALHQDWEDLGSALTTRQMEENLSLIAEIGATCLRCSHYQHDAYTYQLASERGIVVWAEIPNVNSVRMTDAFRTNAKQQLTELIRQNYNIASICMWGIHNEQWPKSDLSVNKVLDELYQLGKQEDPTRPIVVATAQSQTTPLSWQSDASAWNKYFGWYEGANMDGFGPWVDGVRDFAKANETVSATNSDGSETFTVPVNGKIGISEYGSGNNIWTHELNPPDHVKSISGFQSEEYANKYHEVSWQQIRERPWLWGTFIWNMFDFAQPGVVSEGGIVSRNTKGLASFDRSLKKDSFYFYKANWSDEPMVYISSRRYADRYDDYSYVRVYSNLDEVEVYIDGVSVGKIRKTDPAKPNTELGNLIQDPSLGIFHFEGEACNLTEFKDYTITAIGRQLGEDGQVLNEYSDTVVWRRLKDYRTEIQSERYIIDGANHTISKIPAGLSVAEFLAQITVSYNGTLKMLDASGQEITDLNQPLSMDMRVLVIAENGVDQQEYTLLDDPLSSGASATASTVQNNFVPGNLTDGNLTTRWTASDGSYPQWFQIDLGQVSDLSKFSGLFYGEAPRAYQYTISGSIDGSTFTPLVDRSQNTESQWVSDEFPAGTRARYIRVDMKGISGTSGNAALYECMIYGYHLTSEAYVVDNTACTVLGVSPDTTAGTLLQQVTVAGNYRSVAVTDAAGTPLEPEAPVGEQAKIVVTGSNDSQTVYSVRETTASTAPVSQGRTITDVFDVKSGSQAAYLNDGNPDTFWNATTGFEQPRYAVIDLGAEHQLSRFDVDFYQGSTKRYYQYRIYAGSTPEDLELLVDGTQNTDQESVSHTLPAGTTGRYIKLEITGTSVANVNFAAAVREFAVYGWSMDSTEYEVDHAGRAIRNVPEQTPVSQFRKALQLEGNYTAELLLDDEVRTDGVVTEGMRLRVGDLTGGNCVEYTIHTTANLTPISQGMPCEAEIKAGSDPALAVDGDPATFWNGPMLDPNQAKYPVDFVVDLSNGNNTDNLEYHISKVVLSWYGESNRSYQFSIYGVPNLIVETLWHDASDNTQGGKVTITAKDKNGSDVLMKKLHLQVTGRTPATSYFAAALYELEVYGWLIRSDVYTINESAGTISGIPAGTSVARLRNTLDIRGNYTSRIVDAQGQPVTDGLVESGMRLEIIDVENTTTSFLLEVGQAQTYSVTIDPAITHGTVTAQPEQAAAGETVTLHIQPDEGYVLKEGSLKVCSTDSPETVFPVTDNTFQMPECDVTVTAEFEAAGPAVITGSVVITGEAVYGGTLTADISGVEPAQAQADLRYAWSRGGETVGTEASYVPTADDIGQVLTLTVEGTGAYTGTLSAESAAVAKAAQAAPEGVSTSGCTSADNNDGILTGLDESMEWSAEGAEAWQAVTGATVEGLTPGRYQVRYAETATHSASPAVTVEVLGYEQPPKAETPNAVFEAADLSLSGLEVGMKFCVDEGQWQTAEAERVDLSGADLHDGSTILVYMPGDGENTSDSDQQVIRLSQAASPAHVTGVDETAAGNDGKLTGVDAGMEYCAEADHVWLPCEGDEVTGLSAGTYLVRVAGQGTVLASESVRVTIYAYRQPVTGVKLNVESVYLYSNFGPRGEQLIA
ncbi:discoidin domain-containing protein, partial [Flavonifractor hominis]